MKLTTEALLTSPDGCRLTTATPVQIAGARARDGRSLGDLANNPDVIAAFGGPEAVAALPGERGIKPVEFYNIASARTAKTTLAIASALADATSMEIPAYVLPGETPRLSILSLKLDVADVPFRKLLGTVESSPLLRPLLLEKTSDSILLRHSSGIPIEVAVVAGGKAAGGLAARWSAGLIADEAPKMSARSDDSITNLDDALSVIRERLLPGAQIQAIGSPWAPRGTIYNVVQQRFGKPTDEIVVMRTTGPAGNPSYWTRERLDRLHEKDEAAWRINELGEFLDPESGLASPVSINKNTREAPLYLAPETDSYYAAAVDLSDGSSHGNPSVLVVVEAYETDDDEQQNYRVVLHREWRGGGPDHIISEIAAECKRYGLTSARADQFAGGANFDIAKRFELTLEIVPWTSANKVEQFTNFATIVHSDRFEFPPDRQFIDDILSVKKRAVQTGGFSIILPKTGDGRHADYAPACVAATHKAAVTAKWGKVELTVGGTSGRGWDSNGWGGTEPRKW